MDFRNWVTILASPQLWTDHVDVVKLLRELKRLTLRWVEMGLTDDEFRQLQTLFHSLQNHLRNSCTEIRMDEWHMSVVLDMVAELEARGASVILELMANVVFTPETPAAADEAAETPMDISFVHLNITDPVQGHNGPTGVINASLCLPADPPPETVVLGQQELDSVEMLEEDTSSAPCWPQLTEDEVEEVMSLLGHCVSVDDILQTFPQPPAETSVASPVDSGYHSTNSCSQSPKTYPGLSPPNGSDLGRAGMDDDDEQPGPSRSLYEFRPPMDLIEEPQPRLPPSRPQENAADAENASVDAGNAAADAGNQKFDIADWKLAQECKESGTKFEKSGASLDLNNGQELFTNEIKKQSAAEVKEFVKPLLVLTRQPERVVQTTAVSELRFLISPELLGSVLTLQVNLVDEKGDVLLTGVNLKERQKPDPKKKTVMANSIEIDTVGGLKWKITSTLPSLTDRQGKKTDSDKKNKLSVLDQNYHLHYSLTATLTLTDRKPAEVVEVEADVYSFPIKKRTNVNQEYLCQETLVWDRGAGRLSCDPNGFRPRSMKFSQVVNAINAFLPPTKSPLKLEHYELKFGVIVLKKGENDPKFNSEGGEVHMSLKDFRAEGIKGMQKALKKQDMPETVFFSWFYNLKKFILAHEQVREAWEAGLIFGYMSSEESKNILENSGVGVGAFLIRLAKSRPDAISIDWIQPIDVEKKPNRRAFKMGKTYQTLLHSSMLTAQGLYERIRKGKHFEKFYSEIKLKSFPKGVPKDELFGKKKPSGDAGTGEEKKVPTKVSYVESDLFAKYGEIEVPGTELPGNGYIHSSLHSKYPSKERDEE